MALKIEVFDDADAVARAAAAAVAAEARNCVAARGRFTMAVSGGRTPWLMLRALAGEDVPWAACTSSRWTNASRRTATRTAT